MNFINFILLIVILFFSITLHEYSHGWIANRLGDPTAKISGRLTLNPLAHIDLFGTILLPVLLLIISQGGFSFGYAKPIAINPYHFKNPRRDMMWVGLFGPLANFVIAFFLVLFFKLLPFTLFSRVLLEGIVINLILGIFNLIPVPPLDGSRVISALLPYRLFYTYLRMETFGALLIIVLIMLGVFERFVRPLVKTILAFVNIEIIL
ncbi:MAG: site-2 protease family protein [Candidatus Omnitrophota bacterium]